MGIQGENHEHDLLVADLHALRTGESCELSLIAPAYDEEESLPRLYARVAEVLGDSTDWELVLVDDGSKDSTAQVIRDLTAQDPRVRGIFFAANRGQTAATAAGLHLAKGRLVATLDADMQNDPVDLPGMIDVMGDHDAVVGYRIKRNDTFIRRISSRIANNVRNKLSGDSIRDTGCSLKVFRSRAIRSVPLFEGMHRFLPTLLRIHGFSVIEHGVSHHPRAVGVSKYGVWNRVFKSLRDLFAVRWMRSRLISMPIAAVGSDQVDAQRVRSSD
tara:strand:+ start:7022 stop:7840 length:819 start_codon:yes stop_codon:yes gene_type:complete